MRILIATVTAGAGHLAAAAALEEAWRGLRPRDVVRRIDLVKFFSPLHRKIVSDGYLKLVERAPELWGMMFAKTDHPEVVRRLNRLKRLFPSRSRNLFTRHVKQFAPEAVLCTHFLPLEPLGILKAKPARGGSRGAELLRKPAAALVRSGSRPSGDAAAPIVVSVVTDFEAHALWMNPAVDLYCVAAEETKARLVARGASAEDVIATGIPIAAKFSVQPDRHAVRGRFGLRDDLPLLLVLSGGFGMGPVAGILDELDRAPDLFQTIVVAGRNERLRRELASKDLKHPTRVLGFADNLHEWMAVADLIITKPGGLTSSEALAMGKPILILNPIPGQEAANSDFLLERGAAAKINRVEDLPFRVGQLLGSKKLAAMARSARALGRPKAAEAICGEVVARLSASPRELATLSCK